MTMVASSAPALARPGSSEASLLDDLLQEINSSFEASSVSAKLNTPDDTAVSTSASEMSPANKKRHSVPVGVGAQGKYGSVTPSTQSECSDTDESIAGSCCSTPTSPPANIGYMQRRASAPATPQADAVHMHQQGSLETLWQTSPTSTPLSRPREQVPLFGFRTDCGAVSATKEDDALVQSETSAKGTATLPKSVPRCTFTPPKNEDTSMMGSPRSPQANASPKTRKVRRQSSLEFSLVHVVQGIWQTKKKREVEIKDDHLTWLASGDSANIIGVNGHELEVELQGKTYSAFLEQDGTAMLLLWSDGDRWKRIRAAEEELLSPSPKKEQQPSSPLRSRSKSGSVCKPMDMGDVQGTWTYKSRSSGVVVEVSIHDDNISWPCGTTVKASLENNEMCMQFEDGRRYYGALRPDDGAICWSDGDIWQWSDNTSKFERGSRRSKTM